MTTPSTRKCTISSAVSENQIQQVAATQPGAFSALFRSIKRWLKGEIPLQFALFELVDLELQQKENLSIMWGIVKTNLKNQ